MNLINSLLALCLGIFVGHESITITSHAKTSDSQVCVVGLYLTQPDVICPHSSHEYH